MGKKARCSSTPASDISTKVVKPAQQKKLYEPKAALCCVQAPELVETYFPEFAIGKDAETIKFPATKIYIIEKELNPEVLEELKKQIIPENDKGKGPITYLEIRRKQVIKASNPWSSPSKDVQGTTSKRARVSQGVESSLSEQSPNPVASLLSHPQGLRRLRR